MLYQTGVHRLAIWQSIVPVLVTLISVALKLEPATISRYVAIGMDLITTGIILVIRIVFDVGEYGENQSNDKWYLLYIMIVISSNSVQFVLTKILFSQSKMSTVTFAMIVYFFGALGSVCLYGIECEWARHGHWTIEDMPHMLYLLEEVVFVFVFSCINEVANFLLLLYFIKKTLVTKASVYGIVGSIFIIFVSIFSGKI